jgi:hypothetical protein
VTLILTRGVSRDKGRRKTGSDGIGEIDAEAGNRG